MNAIQDLIIRMRRVARSTESGRRWRVFRHRHCVKTEASMCFGTSIIPPIKPTSSLLIFSSKGLTSCVQKTVSLTLLLLRRILLLLPTVTKLIDVSVICNDCILFHMLWRIPFCLSLQLSFVFQKWNNVLFSVVFFFCCFGWFQHLSYNSKEDIIIMFEVVVSSTVSVSLYQIKRKITIINVEKSLIY